MTASREMTLDECMNQLPSYHLARKQFAILQTELAQAQADAAAMRECLQICKAMVENEIFGCEMAGRSANAWPDLLDGRVSGGGIIAALSTTSGSDMIDERDSLRAEVDLYKKAVGFCDNHQPSGGARNCLVCGCMKLSHALSRICYACEEPNEMEVSSYDVHCNEDAVIEQVKKLRAELAEARKDSERLDWLESESRAYRDASSSLLASEAPSRKPGWKYIVRFHTAETLRAAIDAAKGAE